MLAVVPAAEGKSEVPAVVLQELVAEAVQIDGVVHDVVLHQRQTASLPQASAS